MGGIPMRVALLLGLAACLAGCATGPATPPLPDPAVMAAHEWDHGPPWGPEQLPWVAPPVDYALLGPDYSYYDPSPWYWGPPVGFGLGVGRGYWWGRPRGFVGPRFHGGGMRFHGGGGRRGRR
jgi:hypothetical protein